MTYSRSDLARAWERGRESKPSDSNPYVGCSCPGGPSYSVNGLCCMACNAWLPVSQQRPAPAIKMLGDAIERGSGLLLEELGRISKESR